jgi:hypothetical protein
VKIYSFGSRIPSLLLSITLISIGPKMVESLTYNDVELKSKVSSQTTQILELNARVTELNTQIIENQRECTNSIVTRESEIMMEIAELESRIKKEMSNQRNLVKDEEIIVNRMEKYDGEYPRVAMSPAPEPKPIKIETPQTNQMMLEGLSKIKSNIKKDIKSKSGN